MQEQSTRHDHLDRLLSGVHPTIVKFVKPTLRACAPLPTPEPAPQVFRILTPNAGLGLSWEEHVHDCEMNVQTIGASFCSHCDGERINGMLEHADGCTFEAMDRAVSRSRVDVADLIRAASEALEAWRSTGSLGGYAGPLADAIAKVQRSL